MKLLRKPELLIIAVIIIKIIDRTIKNITMIYKNLPIDNLVNLYFSLFISFGLMLFIRHRYWMIACSFLVINDVCNIFVQKALRTAEVTKLNNFLVPIIILGMFSLVLSSIFIYKFLKLENYEKYFLLRWKKKF